MAVVHVRPVRAGDGPMVRAPGRGETAATNGSRAGC